MQNEQRREGENREGGGGGEKRKGRVTRKGSEEGEGGWERRNAERQRQMHVELHSFEASR